MRDLWSHQNLGPSALTYSTIPQGHDVRLLKVVTFGQSAPMPSTSYDAESAILGGSAVIADCTPCSGGAKVGGLGLGANNNVTFNNVYVRRAGVYLMQVDSMTQGLRSYLYNVNGGPFHDHREPLNSCAKGNRKHTLANPAKVCFCMSVQFEIPVSTSCERTLSRQSNESLSPDFLRQGY